MALAVTLANTLGANGRIMLAKKRSASSLTRVIMPTPTMPAIYTTPTPSKMDAKVVTVKKTETIAVRGGTELGVVPTTMVQFHYPAGPEPAEAGKDRAYVVRVVQDGRFRDRWFRDGEVVCSNVSLRDILGGPNCQWSATTGPNTARIILTGGEMRQRQLRVREEGQEKARLEEIRQEEVQREEVRLEEARQEEARQGDRSQRWTKCLQEP